MTPPTDQPQPAPVPCKHCGDLVEYLWNPIWAKWWLPWCGCRTLDQREADMRAQQMRQWQRTAEKLWHIGKFPVELLGWRLNHSALRQPGAEEHLAAAQQILRGQRTRGYLAWGSAGCGKSAIDCALVHSLLEQGRKAVAIYWPFTLAAMQARTISRDWLLATVSEAEVVLVDDLARLRLSDWVEETTLLLLVAIQASGAILVVNDNRAPEMPEGEPSLRTYAGEPAFDRLQLMCDFIEHQGESHRERQHYQRQGGGGR